MKITIPEKRPEGGEPGILMHKAKYQRQRPE